MQQVDQARRLDDMISKVQKGSMQVTEKDAVAMAGHLFSQGKFSQVEKLCRQFIAHNPNNADIHSLLGVTCNAVGKKEEAVALLKQAIKLNPRQASYRSNLGEILRQQGNLAEAITALQEAIQLEPKNPQAHNNLGITRFESKAFEDAVKSYRTALKYRPNFPEAFNNLGNALRRTGDIEEALNAYQSALALREVYPEAYNNLGTLLREQDKPDQAEHALRKATLQNPKYVEAFNNLASLYHGQDKDTDALRQLTEVLKLAPTDIRGLLLTARIQLKRGNHEQAQQACQFVLNEDPDNSEALTVYGMSMHEIDNFDKAIEYLGKAVEKTPDNPEALNYYGVALKSVGRLDEARETLRKALDLNPNMYGGYANLNDLIDFSKDTELFGQLEKLVKDVKDKESPRLLPLHFAYGKALDDHGKHAAALKHYIQGGQIKRSQLDYKEADNAEFFDKIQKAFPAKIFKDRPFKGIDTDRLVFIIGMPRSGSTLVEQILSSHDDIYGAGEVKYLSQGLGKLRDRFPGLSRFPDMVGELNEMQFKLLADNYAMPLFKAAGKSKIVTDKLLTNYFFVGLIHLMFPNAKIINTRRNPIDCCLSAFTKLFKDDMPHSYDLEELGRYYLRYDKLMKHWEKVLPKGTIKVVEYENVVANMEAEARSLIDFIGVEWDDKLLDFYNSKRPVKTASVAQVRKPIYNTAVERYKKYGKGLQPLIDTIEKGKL
jgi:Flp pilus assembly protein TadD